MPLHLIKLCVGIERPQDLRAWAGKDKRPVCHTRQTPKRGAECVDGGSLYWVIKGAVLCRQAITAVDTIGEGPASRCLIRLSPQVVLTEPQPRRAFQGWRYLKPEDAPGDLVAGNDEAGALPTEMALALRELGAW